MYHTRRQRKKEPSPRQGNDKGEKANEFEPNYRKIGQYSELPEKSSTQDTDNLQELKELIAKEERKKIYDGLNDRYLEKCVVYRHLIAVTYSLADFIIANRKEGIGQRYGLVRDFTPLTNCFSIIFLNCFGVASQPQQPSDSVSTHFFPVCAATDATCFDDIGEFISEYKLSKHK